MEASSEDPGEPQNTLRERVKSSGDPEIEPLAAGTIYKVLISVEGDNALPRDMMQVTPHVRDRTGVETPQNLSAIVAAAMGTYLTTQAHGYVRVYHQDFNPAAPHPPLGETRFGTSGTSVPSAGPREIGLCLSYYASQNTKRFRGRLYIPHSWLSVHTPGGLGPPTSRPSAGAMGACMNFATLVTIPLNNSGNWEWVVASHVDKTARRVTNYWCNDDWDIQRRRGFRETTRQNGSVP